MIIIRITITIIPVYGITSFVRCLLLHAGKYWHFYTDNFLKTPSVQISALISITTKILHLHFDSICTSTSIFYFTTYSTEFYEST